MEKEMAEIIARLAAIQQWTVSHDCIHATLIDGIIKDVNNLKKRVYIGMGILLATATFLGAIGWL
jgi:hypothetical protein